MVKTLRDAKRYYCLIIFYRPRPPTKIDATVAEHHHVVDNCFRRPATDKQPSNGRWQKTYLQLDNPGLSTTWRYRPGQNTPKALRGNGYITAWSMPPMMLIRYFPAL